MIDSSKYTKIDFKLILRGGNILWLLELILWHIYARKEKIMVNLRLISAIIILIIFCLIGFLVGNWSANISRKIENKNNKKGR